ncbi:MAG TPA: hypothetical protein VGR62_17195 [Candidatus Binatia bacterium]|nr:hypothetical protein [Candidatus Binatia bacterium]
MVLVLVLTTSVAADDRTAVAQVGGRRVTLVLRANEPVLLLRWDGGLGRDEVRSALTALLASLFPDGALPPDVRSISVSRVEFLPWLSEKLALAAARDPDWNVTTGKARRGHENAVVAALLDRDGMAREIGEPFARYGLAVRSVSVEKVLVQRAAALPFAERLRAAGVKDAARLPFDAQLWLALERR